MMQLWRGATMVIVAAIGATGRPEERAAGTAVLERAGDERATSGRRAHSIARSDDRRLLPKIRSSSARATALAAGAFGLLSDRLKEDLVDREMVELDPKDSRIPRLKLCGACTTVGLLLPDDRVHLTEFALEQRTPSPSPNVLWFIMEDHGTGTWVCTPACGLPPGAPFTGCEICFSAPYNTSTNTRNPNFSPYAGPLPLTRRWMADPTYSVRIPTGPNGPTFAASPIPFYAYAYQEFMWDVAFTMAKYSANGIVGGVIPHQSLPLTTGAGAFPSHPNTPMLPATMGSPYSARTAIFGGISDGASCPPAVNMGTVPAGGANWPNAVNPTSGAYAQFPQVWSSVGYAGPTGDCVNEVLWAGGASTPLIPSYLTTVALIEQPYAATSMLVDTSTGAIQECDLIFDPSANWPARIGGTTSTPNCPNHNAAVGTFDPPPGVPMPGPGWTTVFDHEVGHFFGLHHSNLSQGPQHAYSATTSSICDLPVSLLASAGYLSTATPGNPTPPNPQCTPPVVSTSVLQRYEEVPGMAMRHVALNYWRTDPRIPVYHDDEMGVAELYPVTAPLPSSAVPYQNVLINDFGRIEGSVGFNLQNGGNVRISGMNVYPLPHDCDYDRAASGIQCSYPPCNTPQNTLSCFPKVGKISGTARLSPNSVVGIRDTAQNLPASGEFQIHGVPPSQDYLIRFESLEALGHEVTPYNSFPATGFFSEHQFGEWFYDRNLNHGGPWPAAPGIPLPLNALFSSIYAPASSPPGYYPGLTSDAQVLLGRRPHATSLGSLYIAPGTVLTLTADLNRGCVYREPVSRPVVQISPRTGLSGSSTYPPTTPTITATVVHDYELNFARCNWVVNGTTIAAGTPTNTTQPPVIAGSGPWTTVWTRPAATLGAGAGSMVRFLAQEKPSPATSVPWRVPPGITPVVGVNEVQF